MIPEKWIDKLKETFPGYYYHAVTREMMRSELDNIFWWMQENKVNGRRYTVSGELIDSGDILKVLKSSRGTPSTYRYDFKYKEDAVHFKMVWG